MNALVVLGIVLIALAALIHVLIFFMESVLWSRPAVWKRFGLKSQPEADTVKPMAYNQGFYNVFLAIIAATGLVMIGSNNLSGPGYALAFAAAASMVLASIVLITSSPKLWRAAAVQGVVPLVGIILLVASLLSP
jgi:putative membrane protein